MRKVKRNLLFVLAIIFQSIGGHAAHAASEDEIPASFAGIESAIQSYEAEHPGKTLKVEEIIQRLPAEFRSGFTLMYDSKSTQPATPDRPRVIMFGDDAQTVLTYNNDLTNLEMASLDPESGALVFRFIDFPAANDGNGSAQFSPPNPGACTACHGVRPHYIWGSYTRWTGAYGSLDDALPMTPGESEHFAAFRQQAPSLPRYRGLIFDPDNLSSSAPYRSPRPGRGGTSRFDYQNAVEVRPNFRLGSLLQRHQAQSAAALIANSPRYQQLKFGLAFYLAGCEQRGAADQVVALVASNGLTSDEDYARALGVDPKVDWQLKRPPVPDPIEIYNASPFTFVASLYSRLWANDLASEAQLAPYYRPNKLGDVVRMVPDKTSALIASPHGLAILDKLDAAGSVMADFAGAEEVLNAFVTPLGLPHLGSQDVTHVCTILAKKQLQSAN